MYVYIEIYDLMTHHALYGMCRLTAGLAVSPLSAGGVVSHSNGRVGGMMVMSAGSVSSSATPRGRPGDATCELASGPHNC